MDPRNQPQGAWNSSEKSGMLQPTPPPPAYQDIPAGYPPSFPSQPVPQGPYAQGPYPGQSVVSVQPAVFVTAAPLANPEPDYMCYSIFTMLCCCLPLGIAALVFSCSTRNANYSGQQALAEKNSKTARTLNHVGVAIGLVLTVLLIVLETRDANMFGHQPIARRNSRMARILNHVSVGVGLLCWLITVIYIIVAVKAITDISNNFDNNFRSYYRP